MQITSLAVALAAIGLVAAVPTPNTPSPSTFTVDYVDKFDDLKVLPVSTGATNKIGIYHGLDYSGLSVASGAINTGRAPPSLPNFIFGGVIQGSQLQLLPANSSVLHFDLESLYYACAPTAGAAVGASQSCTIQIAGLKAPQFGGTTAVKELVYDAELLSGRFIQISFPKNDFSGLVQVSINVISAEGTTTTAAPNFDNVAYKATFVKH